MSRASRALRPVLLIVCALASAAVGAQARLPLDKALRVLPPAARAAVLQRQAQLGALTPAQRARLVTRLQEWDALAPQERAERRAAAAAWRALPESERRQVRAAAEAFVRLPADEQDALRARFAALDASERSGWLLGPALGTDYVALHPLLAQLPDHQRAPMLDALRLLGPEARHDLAVLAQRVPPQGRDELRIALLATPAAQRAHWLRRQVDP